MDNIIEVTNLTKRFDNFVAVDNISFEVRKGEIFAFLGPNGAGKSTTIKILTTLLLPTSGNVIVNGFDVLKDKDNVRKSFGIVFQDPSLARISAYHELFGYAYIFSFRRFVSLKRTSRRHGNYS